MNMTEGTKEASKRVTRKQLMAFLAYKHRFTKDKQTRCGEQTCDCGRM